MRSPIKKVLIIVVTYNGSAWVDYCLGSIPKQNKYIDILCIDNNSGDDTCDLIECRYPSIDLIKNSENLGFGKANNIGLKHFLENEYDFAFLLNQDARIEDDAINQLLHIMASHPEIGILSPVHRSENALELDYNFGMNLSVGNTPGLLDDLLLKGTINDYYETKFVNAALWCMSRQCIEKTGLFDPAFPHYGEDDDYCKRAIANDFKIAIAPKVLANHARPHPKKRVATSSLGSKKSRHYAGLLLKYKHLGAPTRKLRIIMLRDLLLKLVEATLTRDSQLAQINISNYFKLLKNYASIFDQNNQSSW